jgi:ferritin-like protein
VADGTGLHEPEDRLDPKTIDRHRALRSIMEEFEAVDWYGQRVDATSDPTLAAVLAHNRDEEKEHAAMTIEWLRRNDKKFDEHLRTYLFTEDPITEIEAEAEAEAGGGGGDGGRADKPTDGSLGIGSLRSDGAHR